ncbi:MAG: anti-sigma regulatory factor [Candidatus Aminicenantes bacterium]|nr:anti-sigma regulatory factor [Candidatus Aminicenantes bacterium]
MPQLNLIQEKIQLDVLKIESEFDIVRARQAVRFYAKEMKMGVVDQTRITTAVSELFRNMFQYAGGGEVIIEKGDYQSRPALIVTCIDHGPGIEDIERAMTDGYTSGSGMGYGLPGAKRLVDDFFIESKVNIGTTIRIVKWA